MAMLMNKEYLINEISKELAYSLEDSTIINDILEDNLFNKEKFVLEITKMLDIDDEEARNIYESVTSIIKKSVKYKFRHPFN